MQVGQIVKLKNLSIFATLDDRHNPRDIEGTIVEIGNKSNDKRRTPELPVVVDWGGFTNSYKYSDLNEV